MTLKSRLVMISKNGVPTKKMEDCNARKTVYELGLILSEGTKSVAFL